ncbi:MAG: UDP-N-acetylmuramoyl-L-alanine--D-glutamate ligase [Holosporaceae bacterium]|jgi:UDP-N-acetylmuramoylalanine--D-glutamate ligase|nr:UDP-N-acetylmuramoyl-L-alanine--D-glutamate ligase [Holosporaceae bacterium]
MIYLDFCRNRRIGVIGLGKTGLSAVDALVASGAVVEIYDDQKSFDNIYPHLKRIDTRTVEKLDALIVSPGVNFIWPNGHPLVNAARRNLIPVLNDLDLFQRHVRNKIRVCITGTNGKSTTTALVHHVFNDAGKITAIGGNFGQTVLSLDPNSDYFILEISSYQLESSNILGFDTAILLNIAPDHLTRHGGMEGYITSKQKIFANFHEKSTAIVGIDDDHCAEIFKFLKKINHPQVIPISGSRVPPLGVGWHGNDLIDNRRGSWERVCGKSLFLDGVHNLQNVAAAYAVSACNGLDGEIFQRGLFSFKGLEHRQEIVACIDGVQYINDSKATNVDSVEQALKRFDDIIWILGGRPKENGLESLCKYFDRIKFALLIGEAAKDWSQMLRSHGVKNEIVYTLSEAVPRSREIAKIHGASVVLLSPACASFDQFRNFEERGDQFKNLVLNNDFKSK